MTSVVHEEILESKVLRGRTTRRGDSGSPVVSEGQNPILIGMHIAGDNNMALAIPAYLLFTPANYDGTRNSEQWTLLQPEALEVAPQVPTAEEPLLDARTTTPPAAPGAPAAPSVEASRLSKLKRNHKFDGSVNWRLATDGIRINNRPPEVTGGDPETVQRVWTKFGAPIRRWAKHYKVPVELLVATICTETTGRPDAIRKEPGYVSDKATPTRISVGLTQTLISTAREALKDKSIDRAKLLDPRVSIQAGTAYIAQQEPRTGFDPPKTACAYNAGSVRRNDSARNRWKMRQFPIGTGDHADRFVKWFNDCFRYFETEAATDGGQIQKLGARSYWVQLNS